MIKEHHITITVLQCDKCARVNRFNNCGLKEAKVKAKAKGWTIKPKNHHHCPKCSKKVVPRCGNFSCPTGDPPNPNNTVHKHWCTGCEERLSYSWLDRMCDSNSET